MNYLGQSARLALYTEGEFGRGKSKTAEGILRYGKNPVVAVIDSTSAGRTIKEMVGIDSPVPIVASLSESLKFNPDALVLGTAKSGGQLPETWRRDIILALESGLDVVSGLHDFLADDPQFRDVAYERQRKLLDVRRPPRESTIAFGLAGA